MIGGWNWRRHVVADNPPGWSQVIVQCFRQHLDVTEVMRYCHRGKGRPHGMAFRNSRQVFAGAEPVGQRVCRATRP